VAQTIAPEPASTGSKGQSLPARIIGVLTSPRATYADVAARPRWLGVLAFVVLVGGAATFVFLSTDVGKQAMFDQQLRFMEGFGIKPPPQAIERMEQGLDRAPYTGALGQAITLPLMGLIIAGIALGVFNALLGGDGKFKQVLPSSRTRASSSRWRSCSGCRSRTRANRCPAPRTSRCSCPSSTKTRSRLDFWDRSICSRSGGS
jgi:hypothetical protein